MPFQLIRQDITQMHTDAIVNSANPLPVIGNGMDRAIYEAAGKAELMEARKTLGNLKAGEAVVSPAFQLSATYIIHTVGPMWVDGKHGECEILTSCYENSLKIAKKHNCQSIAFPLISTGVYGFPRDLALKIAISVISRFLKMEDMDIYLVVFDRKSFEVSGSLFAEVDSYINENYVVKKSLSEYGGRPGPERDSRRIEKMMHFEMCAPCQEYISEEEDKEELRSLEDVIQEIGETFSESLLRLIDEKGLTDVQVYKKANLDRKLFSKIRSNPQYKPSKKTALALAIALELNLDETIDLLARAELALSPSSVFDLIVKYFIINEVYDIYTINLSLFQHDQVLLGN